MIRSILLLLALAWPVSANDLFLSQLQLDQLGTVAAFDQGRVKSLDSLAASVMKRITGARKPTGTTNLTEMLDLHCVRSMDDRPTIYVKTNWSGLSWPPPWPRRVDLKRINTTSPRPAWWLVATWRLQKPPPLWTGVSGLDADRRPVEKFGALSWARPKVLQSLLTVVAPPDGGFESRGSRWMNSPWAG